MAPIYDKSVRYLMKDMVRDYGIEPSQVFTREKVRSWFKKNYPKIKDGTITAHMIRMSVNAPSRTHYNAKPGEDDLFYQIDPKHFRLYEEGSDPIPIYDKSLAPEPDETTEQEPEGSPEFAYEKDLQNYLARNLTLIEPGLSLFEEEDINGIEFPAGGRFIDILAVDKQGDYVIIELKVSRGYDRVVGQLLRYMSWIKRHHAEEGRSVRGIIVAREISEDLLLACSGIPGIELFEYELSISLRKVKL